jgi:hypothetical protein
MKQIKKLILVTLMLCSISNCSYVETQLGKRQKWQVDVGTPIRITGKSLTQTGAVVVISTATNPLLFPFAIVPGCIPLIMVGYPLKSIGDSMTGQVIDFDGYGF